MITQSCEIYLHTDFKYVCDVILNNEAVDLFQTVKDCIIVGGLTAVHTLKINMIKAEEVSQYGGPQVLFNEMYVKTLIY